MNYFPDQCLEQSASYSQDERQSGVKPGLAGVLWVVWLLSQQTQLCHCSMKAVRDGVG